MHQPNENNNNLFNPNDYPDTFIDTEELYDYEQNIDNADNEELNGHVTDFDDITDSLSDIDFSELRGDFRSSMKQINRKLKTPKPKGKTPGPTKGQVNNLGKKRPQQQFTKAPLHKSIPVEHRAEIFGGNKKISQVIVPRDRKVIVEGVSKFILDNNSANERTKNIGYYKGKKLKELILTFNNNSALDFNMNLFDPSMPLDYLFSTSLNLNNKIQVAGTSGVSYSDVLFYLLANPTMLINAKFTLAGPSMVSQVNQSLKFTNKSIEGKEKIQPYQMQLNIDNMQVQSDIIYFDIMGGLNRPYIPSSMDVIGYKILAGMTVTFCFYYTTIDLKKYFFKEARENKLLL